MRLRQPRSSTMRLVAPVLALLCLLLAAWLWGALSTRIAQVTLDPGVFGLGLAFFLAVLLAGTLALMGWRLLRSAVAPWPGWAGPVWADPWTRFLALGGLMANALFFWYVSAAYSQ